MARVELFSGPERRRRWSEEQKQAVVAAAFAPGAIVAAVARRADVHPGQIYRWRQELHSGGTGFAAVVVTPDADCAPGIASRSGEAIEIQFNGVACLRIPPSTPPGLAAAVVQALALALVQR
jgi:transposase